MEKKEKAEFILEQMRLCIAVKDYIRTQIISKKISTKFFQEEGSEVVILFSSVFCCLISGQSLYNLCEWCVQLFHFYNSLIFFNV